MDEFLIVILLAAVVGLLIKQSRLTEQLRRLEDLFESSERRLSHLESKPAAPVAPPEPVKPPTPAPNPSPAPTTYVYPTPLAPAAQQKFDPAFPGFNNPAPHPTAPAPPPIRVSVPPIAPAFPKIAVEPPTPKPSLSIEERLGQNWLNKLGIVTLVIGVALFLGYQLRTLGPVGKSVIGLTLSLAFLVGGIFLERLPKYRIFARAAIGGGWALTFFVTFALYHLDAMRILHSQTLDLTLMLIVAAAMVVHSLRYQSQVVTSLAFLLAFVTVGISDVTLFSLVASALLAAGLVFVAARQFWFELGLAGLIGVYINHFLWLQRVLPTGGHPGQPFPAFFASAGLLLVYWLIFRLFYVLRIPKTHQQGVISSLTAILNSVGVMSLLKYQSSHPEWAFRGLLILGTAELLFAFVARRKWRTAFVVLSSIASILLLAAIPFRFGGSNWSFLWLLQADILFLAGIHMREIVFRRLGMLATFAAAVQMVAANVIPILNLRQSQPDTTHHLPVAIALMTGALIFWLNSEFAPRRWPFIVENDIDHNALRLTSYLALGLAAVGLWGFFPGPWTIVVWMIATLILSAVADKLSSESFATQSDLLSLSAIVRAAAINFFIESHLGPLSLRAITLILAAALLYLSMRRKTSSIALPTKFIAAAYSWPAAALLGTLLWYELQPISVAVAWAVFGLILFEVGTVTRRNYFRHQAYALLAASFIRIFFVNLDVSGHGLSPRVYTVLPLIAAYFWVYERLQSQDSASDLDQAFTIIAAWFGTSAITALLYFEIRAAWIALAWAAIAFLLLAVAWSLKRSIFIAQALALLLATTARALLFNMFSTTPLAATHTTSKAFCISATCAMLLLALPFAFQIRKRFGTNATAPAAALHLLIQHPEQPFFFAPLVLITTLLTVELRAGNITIGWSALGVVVFLFALTVGERSYRLAGLSLLLLGVAKIILIDIWHASPSDRYITLIVMGAALLLVSFLYSRYRETLLKFL